MTPEDGQDGRLWLPLAGYFWVMPMTRMDVADGGEAISSGIAGMLDLRAICLRL